MILVLVDGPDCTLDVLHTHEALVQRQVVPHSILQYEGMYVIVKACVKSLNPDLPSKWLRSSGRMRRCAGTSCRCR